MPHLAPTPRTTEDVAPASAPLMEALSLARGHLLSLQSREGYWKGDLDTNVTMDAEDIFLRAWLGVAEPEATAMSARWIRSQQLDSGGWANAAMVPADLSTTIEAWIALRMAGDPEDAPHMEAAAAFVREHGGVASARVFTRIWLALFGLVSWDSLPTLPPELMLLPSWVPLNVYDFACWARQTIVALSVVMSYRPVRPVSLSIAPLTTRSPAPTGAAGVTERVFDQLDRAFRAYAPRALPELRERSLAEAERWIVDRQEADGSWGGIQPPWVYSLIALELRGYALDHPVMAKGLAGLETFMLVEGDARRFEACQSPVWDTALAVQALADAGLERDHPGMIRAADWLLDEQTETRGDWAIRRPELRSGGWAFEFHNEHYPDIDDTAEVMLALRAVRHPDPARVESAMARGVHWVLGMQSRGGGWGAFDADNVQELCRRIPFCDFGEVIDAPSADVTAHAIEMLVREGLEAHPRTRDAVRWLLGQQEPDGAWFGRWGVNYVYGTGAALAALGHVHMTAADPAVERAVRWLRDHQNEDGGWGEDVRSYDDPAFRGVGASTPSQSAWALIGLLAVGVDAAWLDRGVAYLVHTQRSDGGWDEAHYTGTGFPGDFYIRYHLYRDVFPVMALGRAARARGLSVERPATPTFQVGIERLTARENAE